MSAYLENSAVATALEKVSFNFNSKERQCQRMFKLLSNTKYWCTKQLVWLSIMCESKNYKWGRKEISKRSMLYIFTYRTSWNGNIKQMKNMVAVARFGDIVWGMWQHMNMAIIVWFEGFFLMEFFCILTVLMVTRIYTCGKHHATKYMLRHL